jgi:hypothetical protein
VAVASSEVVVREKASWVAVVQEKANLAEVVQEKVADQVKADLVKLSLIRAQALAPERQSLPTEAVEVAGLAIVGHLQQEEAPDGEEGPEKVGMGWGQVLFQLVMFYLGHTSAVLGVSTTALACRSTVLFVVWM